MRDMAHSICLIKLYQIMMRKKFRFFVSDHLNGKNRYLGKQSTAYSSETMPMTVIAGLSYASPSVQCCFKQAVNAGFFLRTLKSGDQ